MNTFVKVFAALAFVLLLGVPAGWAADPAVSLKAEYEQTVIAPNATTVHIVINFKAMPVKVEGERKPMSLALVIDRSGSMSEAGKLEYAKMAARDLVNRLNEQDSLALVVYDTQVELLFPLAKMTKANRDRVLARINKLQPSSATNLSGGMQRGFEQLLKADSAGLKRAILLSDGLANQGETVPSRIAAMAAKARDKGVTLTAMGLGEDYDEDLMQLIAQRGGGNYYYIRHPEDSSRFFASELKGVIGSVTKDVRLYLTLGDKVKDVKIYGYTQSGEGRERQVDISDFYSDEERMMVIEYQVEPGAGEMLGLGGVRLSYESLLGDGRLSETAIPLVVSVSADENKQRQSMNQDAQVQVLAVQADEQYALALDAASEGRFEEAEKIINDTRAELSNSNISSAVLESKQESLQVESQRIQAVAAAPASAQQDFVKQGRSRIYNSSKGNANMEQMKEGSSGLEVELLQKALTQAGFYHGPVDGVYSQAVQSAVRDFQKSKGLTVDGIAGPATQNALGLY